MRARRLLCARKASERPACARPQVQDPERSQVLDRQKVKSLAKKQGYIDRIILVMIRLHTARARLAPPRDIPRISRMRRHNTGSLMKGHVANDVLASALGGYQGNRGGPPPGG